MRISYLAFIRLPTEKAHGAQIMKTCEALANQGADISLVVPNRHTGVTEDPFTYYEVKTQFPIIRTRTPDVVRFGLLGFVVSALWFSVAARRTASFKNADLIYSRDAFVLLQYIFLNRRFVYEAHTKPTAVSRFVARRATALVVISSGLANAYQSAGVPRDRIILAPDAVDREAFEKGSVSKEEARVRLGIPSDRPIAMYVGKIDRAKGAHTFAAAADYAPEMMFVLIGAGAEKAGLRAQHQNARFLEETAYRELPQVLSAADVLVIPNSAQDIDASRFTSPLKAFAYMASGKPIVAADVPALREALKDGAVYVRPDNPEALAAAVKAASGKPSTVTAPYTWQERACDILTAITALT